MSLRRAALSSVFDEARLDSESRMAVVTADGGHISNTRAGLKIDRRAGFDVQTNHTHDTRPTWTECVHKASRPGQLPVHTVWCKPGGDSNKQTLPPLRQRCIFLQPLAWLCVVGRPCGHFGLDGAAQRWLAMGQLNVHLAVLNQRRCPKTFVSLKTRRQFGTLQLYSLRRLAMPLRRAPDEEASCFPYAAHANSPVLSFRPFEWYCGHMFGLSYPLPHACGVETDGRAHSACEGLHDTPPSTLAFT